MVSYGSPAENVINMSKILNVVRELPEYEQNFCCMSFTDANAINFVNFLPSSKNLG